MYDIVFCFPGGTFEREFVESFQRTIEWCVKKNIKFTVKYYHSSDIYLCRNGLQTSGQAPQKNWEDVRPFNGEDYRFMMWIDSDMVWRPQDIEALVAHDVQAVSGVAPVGSGDMRAPIGYFGADSNGKQALKYFDVRFIGASVINCEKCGFGAAVFPDENYEKCVKCGEIENLVVGQEFVQNEDGLLEVDFVGFAFMLLKAGAMEAVGYPWFREKVVPLGDYKMTTSEDVGWCMNAGERDVKIHIDPMVRIGHKKKSVIIATPAALKEAQRMNTIQRVGG